MAGPAEGSKADLKADVGEARAAKAANTPPNWLAPRSTKDITAQAMKTIGSAYAPAYQSLGQQTKQAQGLSDKRTADNKYYNSWLDSQMGALQSHAEASNQALQQAQAGLTAQQSSLYTQQGTGGAGAGSINANSLASNQQGNQGMLMNASQQALSNIGTSNNDLNATRANNFAYVQKGQDTNLANLQTALTKLSDARAKLDTSQKGDIAKEISRLQGVEISKAQSTRSYDAAATKLGLTQQLGYAKLKNTANIAAAHDATSAANNAANNAQSAANNLRTTGTSAADAQLAANTRLAIAAGKAAGGRTTPAQQRTIYKGIDTTRGQINQYTYYRNPVTHQYLNPSEVYRLAQNGGYAQVGTDNKGKPIVRHFDKVNQQTEVLNAAFNSRRGGGGVSPGDGAWMRSLGLDPSRYGPYNPNGLPNSAYNGSGRF